jgi:hypothetical protein
VSAGKVPAPHSFAQQICARSGAAGFGAALARRAFKCAQPPVWARAVQAARWTRVSHARWHDSCWPRLHTVEWGASMWSCRGGALTVRGGTAARSRGISASETVTLARLAESVWRGNAHDSDGSRRRGLPISYWHEDTTAIVGTSTAKGMGAPALSPAPRSSCTRAAVLERRAVTSGTGFAAMMPPTLAHAHGTCDNAC